MTWIPRDVKDQVVQYPNRFKIDGVPHTIEPDFGSVTEPGTIINREYLMPIERKLSMASPWTLLQEYKVAGTYTWTAPDLYGDGRNYTIGVCIIGAGGSGGAGRAYANDDRPVCQGGSSGFLKNIHVTVTPGQSCPVVVGAGGASVSTTPSPNARIVAGKNGGSSSFNGVAVLGGLGGSAVWEGSSIMSKEGGQRSSSDSGTSSSGTWPTPCMGAIPALRGSYKSNIAENSLRGTTFNVTNVFNGLRYLAAGGSTGPGGWYETSTTLDDGGVTSGAAKGSSHVAAVMATSPGCGGGAAASSSTSDSTVVTSAAGNDGAVMIYV